MNLDPIYCRNASHKDKKIIAVCFDTQCLSTPICCLECLKYHHGHDQSMLLFDEIPNLFEKLKQLLIMINVIFESCQFEMNQLVTQFNKNQQVFIKYSDIQLCNLEKGVEDINQSCTKLRDYINLLEQSSQSPDLSYLIGMNNNFREMKQIYNMTDETRFQELKNESSLLKEKCIDLKNSIQNITQPDDQLKFAQNYIELNKQVQEHNNVLANISQLCPKIHLLKTERVGQNVVKFNLQFSEKFEQEFQRILVSNEADQTQLQNEADQTQLQNEAEHNQLQNEAEHNQLQNEADQNQLQNEEDNNLNQRNQEKIILIFCPIINKFYCFHDNSKDKNIYGIINFDEINVQNQDQIIQQLNPDIDNVEMKTDEILRDQNNLQGYNLNNQIEQEQPILSADAGLSKQNSLQKEQSKESSENKHLTIVSQNKLKPFIYNVNQSEFYCVLCFESKDEDLIHKINDIEYIKQKDFEKLRQQAIEIDQQNGNQNQLDQLEKNYKDYQEQQQNQDNQELIYQEK